MYSVVIIDDNKIAVEAISKSTDWKNAAAAWPVPHTTGLPDWS